MDSVYTDINTYIYTTKQRLDTYRVNCSSHTPSITQQLSDVRVRFGVS